MAKGIQKVKYSSGQIHAGMSVPNSRLVIKPDQWIRFEVEWEIGATNTDKQQPITWFRQTTDRMDTLHSETLPEGKMYPFKIPRMLCGSYFYYIDASLTGVPNTAPKGLYVRGHCFPKIVTSKWSKNVDGEDVRKTHHFSYGDPINLSLETEGINGEKVFIDVFRRVKGGQGTEDDQIIMTYTDAIVTDGEINVTFGNTYQWFGIIKKPNDVEEFYVKVKYRNGNYISDGKYTVHARFLRIKNKISNTREQPSTNNTAVKIGNTDKTAERISFAAVYFRPLDSWNGEFGFDWLREKDNGLAPANDPAYADIIEGGYLDGKKDLSAGVTGTAYAKLKNQYERLPVANTGYAVTEYFVPSLTLFSEAFVATLPSTLPVKPRTYADLKVYVAIKDDIDRLEFEYDKNLLTVSTNILTDKAKTNSLVLSTENSNRSSSVPYQVLPGSIKITCKKDLPSDKEIKIYCYPKNGMPRLLAGKIVVLKNNAVARKKQKFVLVPVRTNINNIPRRDKTGRFTSVEQQSLQVALHQSIILSSLEMGPMLDLSGDTKFQLTTDIHGNKIYGDYIYENISGSRDRTDGNIHEDHPTIFDYVQILFLRLHPRYTGYYTIFSFDENTYDSFYDPVSHTASAIPGQVQHIAIKNVFLFNGIMGAVRGNDTIAHEGLHGLGLEHTHSDSTPRPIPEPDRKFVFPNGNDFPAKSTDNIMSYGNKTKKSTWKWQWEIVRRNV